LDQETISELLVVPQKLGIWFSMMKLNNKELVEQIEEKWAAIYNTSV
jgi:hypothetical protein